MRRPDSFSGGDGWRCAAGEREELGRGGDRSEVCGGAGGVVHGGPPAASRAPRSAFVGGGAAVHGARLPAVQKNALRRPGFGAKALSLHVGRGERHRRSGVPQKLRFSPHRSAKNRMP